MRANPLRGYTMVVIEPTVVFSSLDSFFGGFGRGVGELPPGRMFTPTETRIIRLILDVFTRSLKDAWSPIYDIDFEHVSSEIRGSFTRARMTMPRAVANRRSSTKPSWIPPINPSTLALFAEDQTTGRRRSGRTS